MEYDSWSYSLPCNLYLGTPMNTIATSCALLHDLSQVHEYTKERGSTSRKLSYSLQAYSFIENSWFLSLLRELIEREGTQSYVVRKGE